MTPLSPRVATYLWFGSSLRAPTTVAALRKTTRLAVLSSTRTSLAPASLASVVPE